MGALLVVRVHVVMVQRGLLLVVQVLVQWALVGLVHLVHVGVHVVDVVRLVVSIVVLMVGSVVVAVVEIPGEIAIVFLVVPGVAVAVGIGLNEAKSDSEDDVKTSRELYLTKQVAFLQHLEVAGKGE